MSNEPLIQWPEPLRHYAEFAGAFVATGAIGFRYFVAPRASRRGQSADGAIYGDAIARAATIGLVGSLLGLVNLAASLPALAAKQHVSIAGALTGSLVTMAWAGLSLLALAGFVLAASRRPMGWPLAALGVVGAILRQGISGNFSRLVVPVHLLAGGFWIGTLFVLLVAGLGVVLRDERAGVRRGALAADMVNAFSPLALASSAVLVVFGVITAWQHLKRFENLWTTPYGWALFAKLAVVAVVFALGAWNWRRQRPRMGSDDAARSIRRSASRELAAAGVVLLITGILVSLPVPK